MIAGEPGVPAVRRLGRRVLLVEDNLAASQGLCRYLETFGFEVSVVGDGLSAIATIRSTAPFDFVLTDLQLPDVNGHEVASAARAREPSTRVALITGWDIDVDSHDFASWGVDWVFPKPLDVHDLIAKLNAESSDGDPAPSAGSRLS
jgi:DNA-binding response OmpR family regulator